MPNEKNIEELRQDALGPEGLKNPQFTKLGDQINPADPSVGISSDVDFTDATNDVSRKARYTLGSYLSSKTQVNKYAISVPVNESENPARVNARGASLGATKEGQNVFLRTNTGEITPITSTGLGIPKLNGQTQGTFFSSDQLKQFLDKTNQEPAKSGDDLLKKIPTLGVPQISSNASPVLPGELDPNDVSQTKGVLMLQAVHKQLSEGNLYNPDKNNKFIKDPTAKNEEEPLSRLFTIQRDLGFFKKDGKEVKVSDMSAMAMALIVRSAGNNAGSEYIIEDKNLQLAGLTGLNPFVNIGVVGVGSSDFRIGSIGDATGVVSSLASAATGQSDLIQVSSDSNFFTKRISPNNEGLPELQSTSGNKTSYGQLTTFLNPFGSKFSSLGMFTMAVASVLILIGVSLAFSLASTTISSSGNKTKDFKDPQNLKYGENKDRLDFFKRALEITNTDYPFSSCVSVGLPLLFGFTGTTTSFTAILTTGNVLSGLGNLFLSAGYYSNFVRRIIVEGTEVVGSFGSSLSIGTNAVGAIDNILKGIENITNSSTYKLIQIAAALGDVQIKSILRSRNVTPTEIMLSKGIQKTVSYDAESGANLGIVRRQISRWSDGSSPLSLKTFVASQKSLKNIGVNSEIEDLRNLTPDRSTVKEIEDRLESEYMPFYIHDLRTHEIFSMPAFITDFAESFSANYASIKGVGRQDPVRLYQDTERTLTFSFMLVAMNERDFDHMWYLINRLTAMCYPQYSRGRLRKTQSPADPSKMVQFIQPFSQVQAASPLVRLRIGDVFKSNYSKFGLARLFGAGSESQLNENRKKYNDAKTKASDKAIKEFSKLLRDALSGDPTKLVQLNINIDLSKTEVELKRSAKIYNTGVPTTALASLLVDLENNEIINLLDTALSILQPTTQTGLYAVSDLSLKPNTKFVFKSASLLSNSADLSNDYGFEKGLSGLNIDARNSNKPTLCYIDVEGTVYICSLTDIEGLTQAAINLRADKDPDVISERDKLAQRSTDFPDNSLFEENNNSIVRSFQTTRGRGLAGFITSLGFAYEQIPWETEMGKRAPKGVKISVGFTPIHDLPLGLDYEGNIRNPSHPVGKYAGSFGDPYDDKDVKIEGGTIKSQSFEKKLEDIKTSGKYADAVKRINDLTGKSPEGQS